MGTSKKPSIGKRIFFALLFIGTGIFAGYKLFSPTAETQLVKNALYRNAGAGEAVLKQAKEFTGEIFEVKDGDLIMDAVKKANAGDLIRVYPGTYSETVYVDKNDITFQGIIEDGEWPTLDGKTELNDAFLYSGNGIHIEGFKITKYKGNGIMGQAGNNFVIRNNWVIDTGVYGIFPQYGKNGLIEYNTLTGIEDAAIYVGMCDNIDVLHNEVFGNVAGIEFENSRHCIAENNNVYDNAGGILAFITPGLPIKTTYDIIIRNNFVNANNHENFATPGSTVAGIPPGTGILVMAADDVIIEDNMITGNDNVGILITDFESGGIKASRDPESEPNPDNVTVLNNYMFRNGENPIGEVKLLMKAQFKDRGPDVLAIGGGTGSTIANRDRYVTFGVGKFGNPKIETSYGVKSFLLDKPAEHRDITKEQLGEFTYYGVCSGCHAVNQRLIGVPVEVIQMIYKDRPESMVEYMSAPKNLREDYPEMPPQNHLSPEAKLAVAEYILTIGK
ncbi:MAG: cytochrome-c peroxidase [Bacteroidetes bacterium MedPE-SWsnd-G1]|nr:MAG: cytochrome-c peroxidase [Bacteroidetes bacterium MedPE-SWsnd-G1]